MLGTGGALGGRLRGLVSIPPPIGHWKLSVVGKARGGLDEASAAQQEGATKSWDLRRKKGSLCTERSNARRVRKEGKSVTEHTATRERDGSVRRGQDGQRNGQQQS